MKLPIKMLNKIFILVFCLLSISISAQKSVIEIKGDAYIMFTDQDKKEQYDVLNYGPLRTNGKLIIKEEASVLLIDNQNSICKLFTGEYDINSLTFLPKEDDSNFNKFCNYFKSFFLSHNSTESKKSYKNNIYAISRGEQQAPSLDFPIEGDISLDHDFILFRWTHDCESCEYIFTIKDLKSKEIIFSEMTTSSEMLLNNPKKYLVSEAQYYWSVKTVGKEMEYENVIINTLAEGSHVSLTDRLKAEYLAQNFTGGNITEMIYLLSALEEEEAYNDAILLAIGYQKTDPALTKMTEDFIYDIVLSQQ